MNEKLELLALAKDYKVNKVDEEYEVECKHAELLAVIDKKGYVEYYRTGIVAHHRDEAMIDITELLSLKEFCEALVK